MYAEVHKRRRVFDSKKINKLSIAKFMRFYEMFLGTLYVACEGFMELDLLNGEAQVLFDKYKDNLRIARNGTFHFQRTPAKKAQFFEGTANRMNWAEDLYSALEDIVQTFIVQCHIDDGAVELYHKDGRRATATEIQELMRRSEQEDETLTQKDRLYDKSEIDFARADEPSQN